MTFRETLATLPNLNHQPQATGLLPPIIRAMGHILYVVADLAREEQLLTAIETQNELTHAAGHLTRTIAVADEAPLSAAARTHIESFARAVLYASNEYQDWPDEEAGPNLKELADKSAALAAFLDFELAGAIASDGGRSL